MGMGIVTDKDFDKEKTSLDTTQTPSTPNPISPVTIIEKQRGRGQGSFEVPDSLRQVIGETSVTDGSQAAVDLASRFGISKSSASAYAAGATSTSTYNDRPNAGIINSAKGQVQKRALSKLKQALSHITPDKLETTKARDLAGIAKDMSAVIKNMEPEPEKKPGEGGNAAQFIIYAPQFRKEETYEVVYAKE